MPLSVLEWLQSLFTQAFPTREVYVRSQGSVRYLTLSPGVQLIGVAASAALVGWLSVVSAHLMFGEQDLASLTPSERDQRFLNEKQKLLERYARLEAELEDSERRFDEVMRQLSGKHGQLESAEGVELALQGKIDANRRRLRELTEQRDDSLAKQQELRFQLLEMERRLAEAQRLADQRGANLTDFISTLEATSSERDIARRQSRELSTEVAQLSESITQIRHHQSQVMAQLEEATQASIGELESVLKKTGVDVDGLVQEIERTYSGEGGPFVPILYRVPEAAVGFPINEESVAKTLSNLQRLNSLKIALNKLPLLRPLRSSYRFTSGFGPRRHPITGRWSQHNGIDLAAPRGTPIHVPVDGVVRFAGVQRGYGKVVKIRHSLGYETVYAHLSAIHVQAGQTVERDAKIGEVGNTGRSTGNHLHYEVRRYGKPRNPRRFIEAGSHVF